MRIVGGKRKQKKLSPRSRFITIVSLSFFATWFIFLRDTHTFHLRSRKYHDGARIAIILPFLSSKMIMLPPYFPIFLNSAGGSSSLIDFLVVHNGQLSSLINEEKSEIQGFSYPENVKFVDLGSMENFVSHFARVADERLKNNLSEKEKVERLLSTIISQNPYILVEFKPAMGYIFQEYIHEYSHWGYSDFDILFGDLPKWITLDELTNWDIVTYGYGDQSRLYLRGQFTFHKNNEYINNLWRRCKHLSEIDLRYDRILRNEDKLKLVSAEGCYSNEVIKTKDISVKYTVKAMSDVRDQNSDSFEYGIVLSTGSKMDKSVIYKANDDGYESALRFLATSKFWFEKDKIYKKKDLQWEIGDRMKLSEAKVDESCMYWVPREFQTDICYKDISSHDTVMLVNGKVYKQRYQEKKFPNRIISKAFFHFQEWKRIYRPDQLYALSLPRVDRRNKLLGWQLFEEGAVPLFSPSSALSKLKLAGKRSNSNDFLPSLHFCLVSSGKRSHSSSECDYSISWTDDSVLILSSGDWLQLSRNEITLIIPFTLDESKNAQDLSRYLLILNSNLELWVDSPVVILLYAKGSVKFMSSVKGQVSNMLKKRGKYLVGIIHDDNAEEYEQPSMNALFNMAESVKRTRWILTGLDINQGLEISQDSLKFTKRAVAMNKNSKNDLFILPFVKYQQIDPSRISLVETIEAMKLDESDFTDFENLVRRVWAKASHDEILPSVKKAKYFSDEEINIRALAAKNFQNELLSFAEEIVHFKRQPVLLIDTDGDLPMQIIDLPQECTYSLRIAQYVLMNYAITVLPGAFVFETWKDEDLLTCQKESLSDENNKLLRNQLALTAKQYEVNEALYSQY